MWQKITLIALLIAICLLEPLAAEEPKPTWPQRRGVDWNAISTATDELEPWEPDSPPVAWTRKIGTGYSGFTAADGRLYTQTQSLTRQTVECLNPKTGQTLWQYAYAWPFDPAGMYPGPRATPTWHDGKVYYVSPDLLVGCLDGRSGKRLWERDLTETYHTRGTNFGYACSATIVDGRLILPIGDKDAAIVALDPDDGSTIWTAGKHRASYCSAIPVRFAGHRFAVVLMRNDAILLDVATGKIVWEKQLSSGYDEHSAAPLWEVIDGTAYLVIAQPFEAGVKCFRFTMKDKPEPESSEIPELEAELAWSRTDFSNDTASSVLYRGHVYGFALQDVQAKKQRPSHGIFKCLDVTDGHVCWESDRPGHATVIVADEKLLMLNDSGEFILARASPEKYDELARATIFTNEICWTAPIVSDGRAFLRSPTRAAAIALKRAPTEQFDYQLPSPFWTELFNLRGWVAGERPYMMDPPDLPELWRWYLFSTLGVLLPAGIVGLIVALFLPRHGSTVFWCVAFLLGILGVGIYNRLFGPFVLTWPVCLALAHQRALNLGVLRRRTTGKGGSEKSGSEASGKPQISVWSTQRAILFLIVTCWIYYAVCNRLGMALEWAFLIGFVPSWLIALPVAYFFNAKRRPTAYGTKRVCIDFLGYLLSFTAFFWSAGLYYFLR